jgi:outer membrane protein assembly factor BamB
MPSAPRRTRSTRIPGPVLVLVSLLVIAAAVAGAWHLLGLRPNATGIIDLSAIDGEYAVVVRNVARDPRRSFLSLISAERGEVWGGMIPGYVAGDELPGHVGATAGVVSVRVEASGIPYIHAFAAARGAKLGRYPLVPDAHDAVPAGSPPSAGASIAGNGQLFELVTTAAGAVDVVAIDLEQGRPLWRRTLAGPDAAGPVWLRERHLLVHQAGRLHILDRSTGQPAPDHADGAPLSSPCALADRVYGMQDGAVAVLPLAGGALRQINNAPAAPDAVPATGLAGICGRHGNDDVLLVVTADGAASLVAVDAHTLTQRWRLDLGQPPLVSAPLYRNTPDALAGPLSRFLPVLAGQPGAPRLLLIDLDAGRTVRESAPASRLRDARIMHAGGRFYLWTPEGPTLAVIDGATGTLTAAAMLPGMAPTWPRHIAGGHVWAYRPAGHHTTDGAADRAVGAWLVLDGVTLAVVAAGTGNDVTARNGASGASATSAATGVRAELARTLGLP